VPLRLRNPVGALIAIVLIAAVVAAVIIFVVGNTHHGTGTLNQPPPKSSGSTPQKQISLCGNCAHDYNPDAFPGSPKTQHPTTTGLAIDNDRNTGWTTEDYPDGLGSKPGVGIYVDAKPGVAAGSMVIDTATPGYAVSIFGSRSTPDPNTFTTGANAWTKIGAAPSVTRTQTIDLRTGGAKYRYYLVWITSLGDHDQVAVNEVALYK
jgi:serine/threonine-protein kinase